MTEQQEQRPEDRKPTVDAPAIGTVDGSFILGIAVQAAAETVAEALDRLTEAIQGHAEVD